MTMKAHTYYIIFGRPPIGGEASPPSPWRRHCVDLPVVLFHAEGPANENAPSPNFVRAAAAAVRG